MKAIRLKKLRVKVNGLFFSVFLIAFFLQTSSVWAQHAQSFDSSAGDVAKQLKMIQEKLDQSEQREKKILANQDKILEEVIKSRMWLLHRK